MQEELRAANEKATEADVRAAEAEINAKEFKVGEVKRESAGRVFPLLACSVEPQHFLPCSFFYIFCSTRALVHTSTFVVPQPLYLYYKLCFGYCLLWSKICHMSRTLILDHVHPFYISLSCTRIMLARCHFCKSIMSNVHPVNIFMNLSFSWLPLAQPSISPPSLFAGSCGGFGGPDRRPPRRSREVSTSCC